MANIAAISQRTDMHASRSLRIAVILSTLVGLSVLACTVGGLFVRGFYHLVDPALLAGTYGQDWMSLALVPVLAWALRSGQRGSLRGLVVWLGLLVYYL